MLEFIIVTILAAMAAGYAIWSDRKNSKALDANAQAYADERDAFMGPIGLKGVEAALHPRKSKARKRRAS